MIRAKVLGRKLSERLLKPDLKATFSDVCLVKTELRSNDRTIQVRDGCYFHEQKNDIIKTNKDLDVFVVALKRAVFSGFIDCWQSVFLSIFSPKESGMRHGRGTHERKTDCSLFSCF